MPHLVCVCGNDTFHEYDQATVKGTKVSWTTVLKCAACGRIAPELQQDPQQEAAD
jgi:hypothetical protein